MLTERQLRRGNKSKSGQYAKAVNCMRFYLTRNKIKFNGLDGYNLAVLVYKNLGQEIDFERKTFRKYIVSLYSSNTHSIISSKNKDAFRTKSDSEMIKNNTLIYESYLLSKEWKDKRIRILGERGHRCENCKREDGVLHLHHLTYERIMNELDSDLMVLCQPCHQGQHTMPRVKRFKAPNPFLKPKIENRRLVPKNVRFNKNDKIKHRDMSYICICCDHQYAVFSQFRELKGGAIKVKTSQTVVVDNSKDDDFVYVRI